MALADTGLLAGRTATTNTGTFDYVESHSATTTWLYNLRYVDDGNIITSTNLTGGIDAALHTVDRFGGRATALDVARQIGYSQTPALDDPRFTPPSDSNSIAWIQLNSAFEGPKQRLGVLLYDGVTELGLSGLIDPVVAAQSARTFVLAPQRTIVRSRDGFQFLPRYDYSSVPSLDRVVVPAGENAVAKERAIAAWSMFRPQQAVEDIYQNVGSGQTAYDATLVDLARIHNGSLARVTAEGLYYNAAPQVFSNSNSNASWPVSEVLAYLVLSLLGAAMVFVATHVKLPRRTRLQPIPQPA
jgi:AraC family transcriptional regulator, transcriptional activator FtrA